MGNSDAPVLAGHRLTATADVPDFRDWTYQPALQKLGRSLRPPSRLTILDQGDEGACTGFALAAVVKPATARRRAARARQ